MYFENEKPVGTSTLRPNDEVFSEIFLEHKIEEMADKKAITSAGAYLIINNAKHRRVTSGENSVFEISEVKFYGNPL